MAKPSDQKEAMIRTSPIRFESRALSPNSQPVATPDLRQGRTYFRVHYTDDEKLVPIFDTLVFIGQNLNTTDNGQVYFQDLASYSEGVEYKSTEADCLAIFYICHGGEISDVFEYEQAIEELMRCSLRRNGATNPPL